MNRFSIATAAVLVFGIRSVLAQSVNGSDTLEPLTSAILASNCFGAGVDLFATPNGPLNYLGGGSGLGESRMLNDTLNGTQQLVAPMSRALSPMACASPRDNAAEGVVIGLDAVLIVADSEQTTTCGAGHADRGALTSTADKVPASPTAAGFSDIRSSGSVGGAMFSNWKDVLRLLYFGLHPQTGGTAGTFAACNHADRHLLLNTYGNLFELGCAAPGACDTAPNQTWEDGQVLNTGIKHAYRRGDTSGTTDTFIALLGAPAIATNPFCNGGEKEDRDPVRRKCDQTEQVCEADGTLGVVLPIVIPTISNDPNVLYNDHDPNPGFTTNWCATQGPKLVQRPNSTSNPPFIRVTGLDSTGDITTEEVTGCSPTTPRCDYRYPSPNSTGCKHANGSLLTAAELVNYTWNAPFGTSCWTAVISTTIFSSIVITRWGVLNGDTNSGAGGRDNGPVFWGLPTTFHPENTKFRCCDLPGAPPWTREDPRVMNLQLRDGANGKLLLGTVNSTPAFYRIHSNDFGRSVVRGGACANATGGRNNLCQHTDATFEIGCLAQANLPAIAPSAPQVAEPARNCSVGFAGLPAATGDTDGAGAAHAEPLALAAVDPTRANLQNGTYPMARRLLVNSMAKYTTQFPNIAVNGYTTSSSYNQAYENLARCYADAGRLYAPAASSPLESAGFVPLPGGKPLLCSNMCSTNAACTTLVDPF